MKIFVRKRHGMTRLIVSLAMMVNLVLPGTVAAQIFASQPTGLPAAGERVNPSEAYTPALIQGVNLYPDNPLLFDFVVDTGDDDLSGAALKEESARLVRYFLAALTRAGDRPMGKTSLPMKGTASSPTPWASPRWAGICWRRIICSNN